MQIIIERKQIIVPQRYRKEYGDLSGITDSIARVGLIHPLVLSKNMDQTSDGLDSYTLVAGGRRISSCDAMGVTKFYHGSTLNPEKLGFIFEDEVPLHKRLEAELDENLYRLNTKWHEDVLLVADTHAAKRDIEGKKWGTRQTAAILGPGYSKSSVSNALQLAKRLRAGDKEITACDTMSDALALLVKRREEEALAEAHRRAKPGNNVSPLVTDTSSFLDSFSIKFTPSVSGAGAKSTTAAETSGSQSSPDLTGGSSPPTGELVTVPLSKMFQNGDFATLLPHFPPVDHIVTDIPYGIDMSNLDTMVNIADVEKEHDVQQNVSMMEPFLKLAYEKVKSGGFCVFFYDLDWHEYLQSTAEAIGWKVQRWPLIAYKTSACRNNAAQYNFTKNYECAMVLRKDEKTVLRKQQPSSVWMGDFSAERRLYNNPFAKPFELWKWIYDAISFPGQTVLDPFCGEMSACRAAANCGLLPFGIELSEKHYLRGLEHMKAVYALIHKSNVQFV